MPSDEGNHSIINTVAVRMKRIVKLDWKEIENKTKLLHIIAVMALGSVFLIQWWL